MNTEQHLTDKERISILETQNSQVESDLKEIKTKLDQLLDFKSKGLGAIWVIGFIVSSGLVGLISTIIGLFKHS